MQAEVKGVCAYRGVHADEESSLWATCLGEDMNSAHQKSCYTSFRRITPEVEVHCNGSVSLQLWCACLG